MNGTPLQGIAQRRALLQAQAANTRAELGARSRELGTAAGLTLAAVAAGRILARRPLLATIAGAGFAAFRLLRGSRRTG